MASVSEGPGRLVAAGAALLDLAVLADSGLEHYRGSFKNPAMVLPLVASSVSLAFDGAGTAGGQGGGGMARGAVRATSVAVGLAGLGFHAWNIGKRPGGVTFTNLFYGAPVGAPGALVLAGAVGAVADALRREGQAIGPIKLGSGTAIGALAAFGIMGTVSEAGLLHFRGAYHNPAMWLPVVLPPVAALSLAADTAGGTPSGRTEALLAATALLGFAGMAFHAYGVHRNMGGWRNWRQNLLAGPPIPAPPSFTGLALAGLGALLLMGRKDG